MEKDVKLARALSSRIARHIVKLAAAVTGSILLVLLLAVLTLAYAFTNWWLLLLLPWSWLATISLLSVLVAWLIARGLYRQKLTDSQSVALDDMTDKIQRLLEARTTPLPVFALLTVKDLLLHRDITTIKQLIRDTASLKTAYAQLQRLF